MRRFYILSGGTFSHIAPHFSVAAPAFGKVGRELLPLLRAAFHAGGQADASVHLALTRMALGGGERRPSEEENLRSAGVSDLITNEDVEKFLSHILQDPETRGILLPAAMVDFNPSMYMDGDLFGVPMGRNSPRLKSSRENVIVSFHSAPKVLPLLRKERKDIFVAGFKTTAGATLDEQYLAGLGLLKSSGINLVLANDINTRLGMVITPEQARYHVSTSRHEVLKGLAEMYALRCKGHFTRSTVVPGDPIPWGTVDSTLKTVVDHCISRGAYKPFRGVTVGHFAARGPGASILTSRRKTNFNNLNNPGEGLVQIDPMGYGVVIAHGAKPSVGGQSQRSIFTDHQDVDCIFHAHVPIRPGSDVPMVSQRPFECGSTECGENTSRGLKSFGRIKAVMLDNHGPNVAFPKDIDPMEVINFIEANFDLEGRTDNVSA